MLGMFNFKQYLAGQKKSNKLFLDSLVKVLILKVDLTCAHVYQKHWLIFSWTEFIPQYPVLKWLMP